MAYRNPNASGGSSKGWSAPPPQLLDQPGASVGALGQGLRTRYRRVQGPNAISKFKPISADLPLKPNSAPR